MDPYFPFLSQSSENRHLSSVGEKAGQFRLKKRKKSFSETKIAKLKTNQLKSNLPDSDLKPSILIYDFKKFVYTIGSLLGVLPRSALINKANKRIDTVYNFIERDLAS